MMVYRDHLDVPTAERFFRTTVVHNRMLEQHNMWSCKTVYQSCLGPGMIWFG